MNTLTQRVGINMEQEVVQIGAIGGFLLCVIMASLTFAGLHINKPFPWEKRKQFDKDDVKYKDGDNTWLLKRTQC